MPSPANNQLYPEQLFYIQYDRTTDTAKIANCKEEPVDYSTLAHYSSLIPSVELELLRNPNLAQQLNHHSSAYPIKPSAHYAINFLRNSLANALLPSAVANNFHQQQQSNDTPFSMLNNAHQPINNNIINSNINSNNSALTPPVQPNNSASPKSSSSSTGSQKEPKQPANLSTKQAHSYTSGHSINHQQQQQLINPQTANHTSSGNRLLHNSNLSVATSPQLTPIAYPLSTLAWMSSARGKPRRGMMRRAVFSDAQRQGLEKRFQCQKYISKPDRKKLADDLGLKDAQVKIWFQNR